MPSVATRLNPPLLRYAARLHRAILDHATSEGQEPHHVASPLGAWLLLGLTAHSAEHVPASAAADGLAEALGCSVAEASGLTGALLRTPHPVVRTAAAAWLRPTLDAPGIRTLLEQLPCTSGDLPSQPEADRWARDHTDGLIERFPTDLADPVLLLLLATAVAARLRWVVPFEPVPAAQLGAGGFAQQLTRAMRAEAGGGHELGIYTTPVGPVAAHVGRASGMRVLSVIADPAVPSARVLEAALGLATDTQLWQRRISLWDLPLGDGFAWTIQRVKAQVTHPREEEIVDAVLPAWAADSTHDLVDLGVSIGFAAAGQVLAPLLGLSEFQLGAAQSALARFDRRGFEAAALSFMAMGGGMPPEPRPGKRREARLRFGHPYAVVAVADDLHEPLHVPPPGQAPAGPSAANLWDGIPVFSAWVSQVHDCEA